MILYFFFLQTEIRGVMGIATGRYPSLASSKRKLVGGVTVLALGATFLSIGHFGIRFERFGYDFGGKD
jgi:hypothetical protein